MAHFYSRVSFMMGLAIGVFLAVSFKKTGIKSNYLGFTTQLSYEKWFKMQNITRKPILWDDIRYSNKTFYLESQYLYDNIKILCIILIKSVKNLNAANNTWTKGCNHVTSIYLETRSKIMPIKRSKENSSWVLLCNALNDVNDSFDWIFVIRDTTFVIMENFRYYVASLDSNGVHYLGYAEKFWGNVYNSGDAGYAISKGTIHFFKKKIGREKCQVNSYWNKEDFYLGKHLATLNITPTDTSDEEGLSTFHPYSWYHVFYPGDNYYKSSVFPVRCCSKKSITFQATEGDKMYTFHYIFYKLQIFYNGNNGNLQSTSSFEDDKKVWREFLKERAIHDENISGDQYYKLWEDLINDPTSFAQNMKKEHLFDYE